MKIIIVHNNYPISSLNNEAPLTVYTLPDTAILKDGKPFFIPDFATPCCLQGHLVVKICRLGRSISERFAHRYYDAITVGTTFSAEKLRETLAASHLPWDIAVGFDGAASIGKLIPLYANQEQHDSENEIGVNTNFTPLPDEIHFAIHNNDVPILKGVSGDMLNHIDKVIATISKHYTLRQGDLIFTGSPVSPQQVHINDKITGYLGDEQVLRFNVK